MQLMNIEWKWNIPNLLSLLRILLVPVFVILYLLSSDERMDLMYWSFGVLILSGVTDSLDGIIARKCNQITDLGKLLDPVADKLTQIALLLCLMPMKCWWMVAILITKEASIGILTLIALRRTHSVYSAGWYGKICTVVIYLSMFVLILWRDADPTFVLVDAIVCSALIALAFVLYLIRYTAILRGAGKKEGQA